MVKRIKHRSKKKFNYVRKLNLNKYINLYLKYKNVKRKFKGKGIAKLQSNGKFSGGNINNDLKKLGIKS